MADFTTTINNTLNILGGSPPTLWGVGKWGTMKWGLTLDFQISFTKVLQDTISNASQIGKTFSKEIIGDTLSLTTDLRTLTLSIDDLWNYLFPSETTNAASQVIDQFTKISDASSTQTQSSDPSTTWTDA